MELSIIIVNFNTSSLLRKCLNKVYKALSFGKLEKMSEVIVVDNASSDDSREILREKFPKVTVIKNDQNLGFAKANNQATRQTHGKVILLLNSDTEIEKDALTNLLNVFKTDPDIGVVGGKLLNPDGTIQSSIGFFPHLRKVFFWMFFIDDIPFVSNLLKPYHVEDRSFYQRTQFVDWVTGACFMIKKEIIDAVGFIDEEIFMYGEEMEWCYRIKKKGFRVVFTPTAQILHHKGKSGATPDAGILEEFKALLYFYKKHKPSWQIPLLRLCLRIGALLRIAIFGIIGRYHTRIPIYAKAFKLA